jgi:hypothetical protein
MIYIYIYIYYVRGHEPPHPPDDHPPAALGNRLSTDRNSQKSVSQVLVLNNSPQKIIFRISTLSKAAPGNLPCRIHGRRCATNSSKNLAGVRSSKATRGTASSSTYAALPPPLRLANLCECPLVVFGVLVIAIVKYFFLYKYFSMEGRGVQTGA